MNAGGDAAEQVVRMSLEGVEVAPGYQAREPSSLQSLSLQFLRRNRRHTARPDFQI